MSRNSGKCLDVRDASAADGAEVRQFTCNGGPGQQWEWRMTGEIVSKNSGKCLDVRGGVMDDRAIVQQSTCQGGPSQQWDLQAAVTAGGLGPGVGPGGFRAGGGVIGPVLVHKVEPRYTEQARRAKLQGTVMLYVEVDPNGYPRNVRVMRGLGLDLDEQAIKAVQQWEFRPGSKDGKPVTVAATIEVNFKLH